MGPDATEAEKEHIINAAKMATENYPSFFPGEVSEDDTEDEAVDENMVGRTTSSNIFRR
jgi:hypothetical protein